MKKRNFSKRLPKLHEGSSPRKPFRCAAFLKCGCSFLFELTKRIGRNLHEFHELEWLG
jgi:hypothetical protein